MKPSSLTLYKLISITKVLVGNIKKFIKSKKVFRSPRKSKILIYDHNKKESLIPLFNGVPYEVYSSRWESINISVSVIVKCILFVLKNKKIWCAYTASFIEEVSPSIVITVTDNDARFQELDAFNKNDRIKFISIQNGNRKFNGPIEMVFVTLGQLPKQIYHSNFFCFGDYDVYEYKKYQADIRNFIPCGSLDDSLYRSLPIDNRLKIYDICLVGIPASGIRVEDWAAPGLKLFGDIKEQYKCLLVYLKTFQKRHGVTISVTGSSYDNHTIDADWHRKYLGEDFEYFPRDIKSKSSYSLTDRAKVVVGMHSTLLREALGRGKKVLECNYSGPHFEVIQGDTWLLREKGYDNFEKKLLNLLHMDVESYKTLCGEYPFYLIGYDKKNPTHTVIGDFIAKHIRSLRN
jgi:surface carbohydrate biosynthesis protein